MEHRTKTEYRHWMNGQASGYIPTRRQAFFAGKETVVDPLIGSLKNVLAEHWLAGIDCDHQAGIDTPRCACSQVAFDPQPNVGMAVLAWIEHVMAQL